MGGSKTRAPWYAIAMEAPEDEARIAAIVAEGRATRRRPSRALWLAAAIVGAVCALGFVLLIALDGPALDGPRGQDRAGDVDAPAPARRTGCAGGFGLGLGLGAAIGFALGARGRVGA
jgi:hypothetical protein